MPKFIRIKNSSTSDIYVSENSFQGIDYSKTQLSSYFSGIGALDSGNVVLFTINNESGEQICEVLAKAISSSTSDIITMFDATTGEKIHSDLDSIFIFIK
tara:strand:+ start:531 stop:830 length:300 start_codon:yes stop_codon:yes gene_type:complete